MKFSAACVTTILAALVTAGPIQPDTGSISQGISSTQLIMFELLSQYAGATYCYDNFHGEPHKMSCTSDKGHCPMIESANATNVYPFLVQSTRTAGYIAIDDTNKLIVLSMQGTDLKENPQSLVTNMKLDQVKTPLCKDDNKIDGCAIHGGFYDAALSVYSEVKERINKITAENPEHKLVATGHSLGGALASIVGTMFRNDGHELDLYTYGQPHIGARDIASYIQNQAPAHGLNFRITHDNDIVPQLPRFDWGLWGHFYPEYFITIKKGIVTEPDVTKVDADFLTFKGNEGRSKAKGSRHSLGFLIGAKKGVDAHLDYFGAISDCNSAAPLPLAGKNLKNEERA